jgi:hypothetical protein
MVNAEVLIGIVVTVVVVYTVFRYATRRNFMRGRPELAISELLNSLPENIDRDKAGALLSEVAKCFRFRPGMLRLDDSLSSLMAMDSWVLGKGQEDLEDWLKERGISGFENMPSTVGELISVVVPKMNG